MNTCLSILSSFTAFYNLGAAKGLDCWGPVINLNRDPRWGRNGEAGSECPYLMGEYAKEYTAGFQNGTNDESKKSFVGVVTLKHWDGNSLEGSDGWTRHSFSANVTNYGLQDAYFRAFRTAIKQSNAKGLMCACQSDAL
eukprot:m.172799 g.172799  ORF g.172799 m.172799 type:complete len:139 (+) comp15376_c0_seq12:479-895(+)